ncbi:prostatic acid phosphatase isoform X3 [Ptiloglossa arizonensis]|uniref:prostatic acid phosphatase isoform X3 n=1 Tax=Ptiloglossa arizonensis TaxID=3350558 RepID=UPI003F9F1E7B
MNVNLFIIVLAFFIMNLSRAEDIDLGSIIFANILYRHGDRTPVKSYPNDPYNNQSIWPVPYGQLTNLGKQEHLLLGRWLRKRYSNFLSDLYSPFEIYVQSTDVDRTLMSAEVHLAGLYPPTEMKRIDEENKYLYAYLTEKSGNNISSLKTVLELYDVLFIENLYNKTLPEWTKAVFPDKLKPISSKSFTISAYNKILQRLKSGLLLGEMIDHMEKKMQNTLVPNRKVWMYSAHDETIANMLMTLNVFDPHCPPYTAMILIELRVNLKDQYFVTVSYKNSTLEPLLLTLPGCNALCPIKQFIALTKDVIPVNWEKECTMHWDKFGYNINTTTVIAILTSSILMLILLILSVIAFIYWHYKREHNQYYLRLTTDPI